MTETLAEAMARVKGATTLEDFCNANLKRKGARRHYVCPACNSGNNSTHGTADFHIVDGDPDHFKCFACGRYGDLYDLAGIVCGTEDRAEQLEFVARWAGVDGWQRGGRDAQDSGAFGWNDVVITQDAPTQQAPRQAPTQKQAADKDYTQGRAQHRAYVEAMRQNIGDPVAVAYLASRGIDLETARAWGLGYDPEPSHGWQDAEGQWHNGGRIVIPWGTSDFYHIDRATSDAAKNLKYDKPRTEEVGPQPIWDPSALKAQAFFVVEGALDALAVQACGFKAVAMGTAKASDLAIAMRNESNVGVALLMNDNDRAGGDAQIKMAVELEADGLPFVAVNVAELGTEKDAFEAYVHYGEWFADFLAREHARGLEEAHRKQLDAQAVELEGLGVYGTTSVAGDIYSLDNVLAPIPTGLANLDKAMDGGLPARGLVVIGAVSSVGKTSLVLQVCDYVAFRGRPVLFVTVEQGRMELVSKSISRIMGAMARPNGRAVRATPQAILNRAERERWNVEDPDKAQAFAQACETYDKATHAEDGRPTLYIMEPELPPTVADIRKAAETIARHHGQAPLVAIDYVQLLAASKGFERGSDKQIIDRNAIELRIMARALTTCVIAISSLNRSSYTGSIDLSSFKESGMLEYSADLLIGLQPHGLEDAMRGKSDEAGKAKARTIMRDYKLAKVKDLEVVILKNRNGGIAKSPRLKFDGMRSLFTDNGEADGQAADADRPRVRK